MHKLVLDENPVTAELGSQAPDFTLKNEKDEEWRLSERLGQVVAMLFYPGNETLVCTKQLCSVRDHWTEYVETRAEIIGVSRGTTEEHQKFAEHHDLPFPLLADTDGRVTKMYGHHWWMPNWLTRTLVVVDAKGILRCRKVMVRAFRPSDKEAIAAIYLAQYVLSASRWKTSNKR